MGNNPKCWEVKIVIVQREWNEKDEEIWTENIFASDIKDEAEKIASKAADVIYDRLMNGDLDAL